ncbi:MAG: hypothetical protein DRQ01_02740 [Ignavibacteriae bacterium]|nr:MAG: hypothetical protein DRQ01_02740 [Ignavibacteriota bacterium]
MAKTEDKKIDLLDYLVILIKWKKFLILLLLPTMIVTYLAIYFLIEEQFDAEALIIPADDTSMGGIGSLIGNLDVNLPFDLGAGSSPEMGLYSTIIYSRTNLQKVIDKFNLYQVYKLTPEIKDYKKKAIDILENNISASETEFGAFSLEVRSNSPELAANITNFIIEELNSTLIRIRTEKSRNNRVFLQDRIVEIRQNLRASEDSLIIYQTVSGILQPEEQFKGIIEAYTSIESDLITTKIQKSILEKIKGEQSIDVINMQFEIEEIEKKLGELKKHGEPSGIIPSLKTLPEKAINYFRILREVEINSAILEFVLPLFEQSKIEEKKDIPTLQVIDNAIPPEKKSYPPRMVLTLLMTFSVFLISFIFILIKENENLNASEKMIYVKKNIFKWKNID